MRGSVLLTGDEQGLFARCLAVSAVLHLSILLLGRLLPGGALIPTIAPIEIDLTLPSGLTVRPGPGSPGGAVERPERPARPAPPPPLPEPEPVTEVPPPVPEPVLVPVPVPEPIVPAETIPVPTEPGPVETPSKEPVRPIQPEHAPAGGIPSGIPAPTGAGVGPGSGGAGTEPGAGGGGTDPYGAAVLRPDVLPRLLNRDEVLKNLRRYYPEEERRAGRESRVVVKLHIGVSGRVDRVEILQSGGTAFDEAARSVAERMRFSPAMVAGRPVVVRLPQLVIFQLE